MRDTPGCSRGFYVSSANRKTFRPVIITYVFEEESVSDIIFDYKLIKLDSCYLPTQKKEARLRTLRFLKSIAKTKKSREKKKIKNRT